jgi:hypothetical protein
MMPGFQATRYWLPLVLSASGLTAQTCLVLSPVTPTAKSTQLFNLSLYSPPGMAPGTVQWTFQSPSSTISKLTVEDGPTLTSTGKTAVCAGDETHYNCLAVGANTKIIGNGILAKVTAVLVPSVAKANLQILNPRAASASGDLIPISARVLATPPSHPISDCSLPPRANGPIGGK